MLILRLLRPTDVPKSKANWGFRLKVYYWLLNRLKSMYLRGGRFATQLSWIILLRYILLGTIGTKMNCCVLASK